MLWNTACRFSRFDHRLALPAVVLLLGVVLAAGPGCQMAATGYNVEGVRLNQQGNYHAALAKFQKAVENNPKNADAYYNMAATYHQIAKVNQDPNLMTQAEGLYHQCLDRSPNHVDCHRALAALLVDTDRKDKAFLLLENWASAAPQLPDAHIELARLCDEFGDKERAGRELDQAIALAPLSPQNARAWAARARLREEAGDHLQALANYQQAYQANRYQPGVAARIAAIQQSTAGGTTTAAGGGVVNQTPPTVR